MATLNMVNAGNSNLRVKLVTKSGTGIVGVDPENPTAEVQGLEFTCCMANSEAWCNALSSSVWVIPSYLLSNDLPVTTVAVYHNGTRHDKVIAPETSFTEFLDELIDDLPLPISYQLNGSDSFVSSNSGQCDLIEIPDLGIMIPLNGAG